jgi:hypothetical protein
VKESKAVTNLKTWLPLLTFGAVLAMIAYASTRRGPRDAERSAQARSKHREVSLQLPHHERTVEQELELDLDGVFDGAART